MVDGAQPSTAQQVRQLVRVRLIPFVPLLALAATIAHDHLVNEGREQIV
jgi:hypothetical protein